MNRIPPSWWGWSIVFKWLGTQTSGSSAGFPAFINNSPSKSSVFSKSSEFLRLWTFSFSNRWSCPIAVEFSYWNERNIKWKKKFITTNRINWLFTHYFSFLFSFLDFISKFNISFILIFYFNNSLFFLLVSIQTYDKILCIIFL